VEFLRGGEDRIETRHRGTVAVVASDGRLLWQVGDAADHYVLRSTAKPFQLLPLLLDGLHRADGHRPPLASEDLAVMMSSHGGEPMHTERIAGILARFGLGQEALRCGVHPPSHGATREAMIRAGEDATALHCNCSGKHTGMLAVCTARGWPTDSYLEPDHPLQVRIHEVLTALLGKTGTGLPRSIDGCSLPTYWLPLRDLAQLFAYLAEPEAAPKVEGRDISAELALLQRVGMSHPELIAGSKKVDTLLMSFLPGRVFAKTGADGMHAVALPGSESMPGGLGVAVKVEDGDVGSRIRAIVVLEVLRQLGIVTPSETASWLAQDTLSVHKARNFRGIEVGEYHPVFKLQNVDAN
jgi:L-asparaginase II